MKFEKFNNNPLNLKGGDCVIRAISEGVNKNWKQVYIEMCTIGFKISCLPNDKETIIKYLKAYPMTVLKAEKGKKREKVKDFNKGTYILSLANHLTVVKEGILKDLWDCREKTVYRYWEISK